MVQKLSDILNASKTSELRQLNESFIDKIKTDSLELYISDTAFNDNFVDYKNADMKKRAQTIAIAYRIATQIQIAYAFSRYDLIKKLLDDMPYFENPSYLDRFESEDINIVQIHSNAINILTRIVNGELPDIDSFVDFSLEDIIANIAVTFAWVETYYVTGFFPQDHEIMSQNSETHKKLVQEVITLLESNEALLEVIAVNSFKGKELYFGEKVFSKNYNIEGTYSIIAGNSVIELKTTGTKPTHAKLLKDFEHLIALHELDLHPEDTHTPTHDISKHLLYYPRFKTFVDANIILRGVLNG